MKSSPYFTKSLFKLALECPGKLFYIGKPERYPNKKIDDPFMAALAEGGFQVGALARLYFPGGNLIESRDYEESIALTEEFLLKKNAVIFEAAFRHNKFFIRTDILVKKGNTIELIEVKAKSFHSEEFTGFKNKRGNPDKKWMPYVSDVAFQKYVLTLAHPEFVVNGYLMLADKSANASVDGLNQKFLVKKDKRGKPLVILSGDTSLSAIGEPILKKINVDDEIQRIWDGMDALEKVVLPFDIQVEQWAEDYCSDQKSDYFSIGAHCKGCEFRCSEEELQEGKKDGFRECWKEFASFKENDFNRPMILDVWDFRRKNELIRARKYFMEQMTEEDLGNTKQVDAGMTRTERQMIQIQKAVKGSSTMDLRKNELKREMKTWKYPLHFIDFETTSVAIPFFKGMHPYEGIAFQFSHHQVDKNGRIEHKGEYINTERGKFPNVDFIRSLKQQLEQDNGTIFRYSNHENTYLNMIYWQLQKAEPDAVPDKDQLSTWIRSISHSTDKSPETWSGHRNMVDLWLLVKRFYYDPFTQGSNSIKDVLPAVLNRSRFLQKKYSKPVYGTDEMPSHNFNRHIWIEKQEGKVINPYKLLPPLFDGYTDEELDQFITDPELADGGAAMMAYAKMQFTEMTDKERNEVIKGLLRYCELDTFAMVLIWEFWRDETDMH